MQSTRHSTQPHRLAGRLSAHAFGLRQAVIAGLAVLLAAAAQAQTMGQTAQPAPTGPLEVSAQQWVDQLAQTTARQSSALGLPTLRMEVSVGSLDPRLQLARCEKVEPYLPVNTRLWGRTRIGLRCARGPVQWNVFLPVTVKAFGPAWVLRDQVFAGTVLQPEHAMQSEVDWAEDPAAVMALPEQWQGMVAARAMPAGQTLRQGLLRPPMAFAAGQPVRVLAEGRGFVVTTNGQAMNAGAVGQSVRVRVDNGKVLSGVVLDERTVRVSM